MPKRVPIAAALLILLVACVTPVLGQERADGPTNEKAQKTYKEALEYLRKHKTEAALESFKKADKQDGGHCLSCQQKMIKYGIELGDWKTAETAALEIVAQAQGEKNVALAHYQLGLVLMREGSYKHKDELFARAHEEMAKALAAVGNFPDAILADGRALAHLKQDDAAKAQFERFAKMKPADDPDRQRALRYISQPELARQMTVKLAGILRALLKEHDAYVPFREELKFTDDYLDIEVVRFGADKLHVEKDIDPLTLEVLVPSILLQPLIENSIKHGLEPRIHGGTITLRSRLEGDRISIEVSDDGVGMTGHPDSAIRRTGSGIGMKNVQERLEVLYGNQARFNVVSSPGRGTVISIEIPASKAGSS